MLYMADELCLTAQGSLETRDAERLRGFFISMCIQGIPWKARGNWGQHWDKRPLCAEVRIVFSSSCKKNDAVRGTRHQRNPTDRRHSSVTTATQA